MKLPVNMSTTISVERTSEQVAASLSHECAKRRTRWFNVLRGVGAQGVLQQSKDATFLGGPLEEQEDQQRYEMRNEQCLG